MSTGRQFISEVRSLNKLFSGDNNITDRVIYGVLRKSSSLLIKRETNLRKLWNSPNIFTPIECLEMVQVPLSECAEYKNPFTVSRSKEKIPQIAEGIFGLLVQSVFSPGRRKYDYASLDRFVNFLSLGIKNVRKYFWIYNDYLYVSDENVEFIDLIAYFDEDFNPATLSACGKSQDTSCINPLDKEFPIPSYLEKQLIDLVSETLNKTYFRHLADPQTNAKDEQKS
jgi:hypothetical protein